MKFQQIAILILTGTILIATAFQADARDRGVNARQHRQVNRTKQGVRTGELTKDETKALASEQRAIRKEEKEFKSDGELTTQERKELHKDLKESSRDIYEQKHDDDKRE